MSKTSLTEVQKDLICILRALGVNETKIISIMPLVEEPQIANMVADKILQLEDDKEKITLQKVIQIMSTVYNEN